ncbi:hypothetical protein Cob_v009211 [Colletotrichum orbiculare MAFF 240422]|uniref:Uncharacterized protein n=1 Tax=Colletotrichum orbiculare (strain 104-T / ATCC 96160 / CBS 514.97 / LARS 414 / MAFF 240422) TaxID=1213857 RepID=N4VUS4_COLOR|nr:hypothetical protein Cob_v009211 [Colletotrichum orbiculare MAFF 240422]
MAPSEEEIEAILRQVANGFREWPLSLIMHSPEEAGMDYEEIIIASHPRWFNRAGLPSHVEPWSKLMPGNDFQVNFIPDYKILHDAGCNVLAYDIRHHGHSGSGNHGLFGVFEWRDIVGSLAYIRGREDTRDMAVGLFSRCAGANATLAAMKRRPEVFEGVRCMLAPQPLSLRVAFERALEQLQIPVSRMEDLERHFFLKTSFKVDQMSPPSDAKHVRVPTFLY